MKTTVPPARQRTFDNTHDRAPHPLRRESQPTSEPFVSPVANIPTNRTPLTPTSKPR